MSEEEKDELEEEKSDESELEEDGEGEKVRLSILQYRPYRFIRSFRARLIQSDEEIQYYYSELKNELLSYKHCHIRISWNHELYNVGRNYITRMIIRGKTLVLYFPLELSDVPDARFALEETGDTSRTQKTPTLFRVTTPARLEYAKELIRKIFADLGEEKKKSSKIVKVDYAQIEYETTESLLNQDQIRLEMRPGATPKIIYLKKRGDEDVGEEEPVENSEENASGEEEEEDFFASLNNRKYSFDRSYASRLVQSDDKLKFFYSEIKNAALSYKWVKARRSWDHELFSAGRPVLFRMQIRGKTLCLYLPLDPSFDTKSRFSLEKAPETKKNEKTPTMLRINTQSKCSFAISLIPIILGEVHRDKKIPDYEPQDFADLPYETTESLLNKDLIRLTIRKDEYPPDLGGLPLDEEAEDQAMLGETEEPKEEPEQNTAPEIEDEGVEEPLEAEPVAEEGEKYDHVKVVTRDRKDRLNYEDLLRKLEHGEGTFEYRKSYMLRAIDENWVTAIEECIPIIDKLIRHPTMTLQEVEEILPIEKSRKITQRSVQHLCQHVNLVAKIEDGFVTPNKLLNVYYDETIKTYENKFLNTLLMRLFVFVNKRYELAKNEASDVVRTSVTFNQTFKDDESATSGKIHFYMELDEKPKDILIFKNYTYTTDLWKRVERLNQLCYTNINSDFARQMEKTYVRPPIMRTNALMKNKDFHQCLLLWQYIENYENAGYELMIQDELKKPNQEYFDEFCKTMTDQYLSFVHSIREGKNQEETLDTFISDHPFVPKVVDNLEERTKEEFDLDFGPKNFHPILNVARYRARRMTAYEKAVVDAVEISLEADRILRSDKMEEEIAKLDAEIEQMQPSTMALDEAEKTNETIDGDLEVIAEENKKNGDSEEE